MKDRYRIQSGFRASLLGRVVFHRWFYVGLGVAVVAGGVLVGGRWAYAKWMNRQSWKFAVDAADYRTRGRISEALMSAKTSLRLNPDNPAALRELARLAPAHVPKKEALEAWQRLDSDGGLTRSDALAYAMLAGSEGEWTLANRLLDRLEGSAPGVELLLLRSRFCDLQGDTVGAEGALRQAVEIDPTGRSRFALALFLLDRRADAAQAPEILEHLRAVAEGSAELAPVALATGLERGIVPAAEMPGWIARLRSAAGATPSQLLAADTAAAVLDPGEAPLIAAKVYARMKPSPLVVRRKGFLWLCRNGQAALALKLVTPREARLDARLFKAWLDAASSQREFEQVLEALEEPDLPVPPLTASLYRARTLGFLGRKGEGRAIFERELAANAGNPARICEILDYLQSVGEDEMLDAALDRSLGQDGLGHAELHALVAGGRDLERLRRFNLLAAAREPANPVLLNEVDYTALVMNGEVDLEALVRRAGRNPSHVGMQTTLALGYLRENMPAKAQGALLSAPPSADTLPLESARHAFVQALVDAANGDREGFRRTHGSIDSKTLTRQEMERLRLAGNGLFADWSRFGKVHPYVETGQ